MAKFAAREGLQKVVTRGGKDRPITIRLDSESRSQLDALAALHHEGPSTYARRTLMAALRRSEATGAKQSHPCAGCKWLEWDGVHVSRVADAVALPICRIKYPMAMPVARCDYYGTEK